MDQALNRRLRTIIVSLEKRKKYGAKHFRGKEGRVLVQSIIKNMGLGPKDLGLGSASCFM